MGECYRKLVSNLQKDTIIRYRRLKHTSLDHRTTQVLRPSGITKQINIQSLQFSILVDSNLPPSQERVPLTGCDHILVSVKHGSHWTARLLCCQGTETSDLGRASFLSAKASAYSLDSSDDLVGCHITYLGHVGLRFCWILGACKDLHFSVFGFWNGNHGVRLQVKMLLAANPSDTGKDVVSLRTGFFNIALLEGLVVCVEAVLFDSLLNGEDGWQVLVVDFQIVIKDINDNCKSGLGTLPFTARAPACACAALSARIRPMGWP